MKSWPGPENFTLNGFLTRHEKLNINMVHCYYSQVRLVPAPLHLSQIYCRIDRNNYSIIKSQREFRAKFKSRSAPAKHTIKKIYDMI